MKVELADRQKNIRETARKNTDKVHKETGFDVDKIKDQDKIFEVFSDLAPKSKTEQQIKEEIIREINLFLELMKAKLDPNNSDVPNFYSNDDRVNTIKKYYKGDIKKAKFILQLMDNLKIDKDNKDLLEAYKEAIKKYFNEEIKIEKIYRN
jgi:hypothetical protein